MKKLLSFLPVFIAFASFGQDSSKTKINVTIQARDVEYIGFFAGAQNRYEDLDSTMKALFRVTNTPTGNTNVTINSVEARVWLDIYRRLVTEVTALQQNVHSRIETALRVVNNVWLTNKLDNQVNTFNNNYQDLRQHGRNRLKKELNESF